MRKTLWLILALAVVSNSGCVPIAAGAAGAVIADKAIEDKKGGDGLF